MTLIAGFSKDVPEECPILMGDLLVSSTDRSDKEIVFPTIGKISNKYLSNGIYRPTDFCQKVNLLSPKLAIACAGRKAEAKRFMLKVMDMNLHNNPTRDSLREVFNSIGGSLSIIGIYRNGREMCLFDFKALQVNPPPPGFEWFKAEGSGYDMLLDVTPNLKHNIIRSGQPNKLEKGISAAVLLSGSLLSLEIQTASSLRNLYGAGYEIVHPLGSNLVKFCDLTYLFWRAEERMQGKWKTLPFPFLASNYSYHEDILVIRSVRVVSDPSTKSYKINADDLHMIEPVYRTIRNEEFVSYTPHSLNSKWICNVFCWKNYHGAIGAFASHSHYGTELPPVRWKDEFSSNASIDIDTQFVQDATSRIALVIK